MLTLAALQGLSWTPVLWGLLVAWLGWRLNVVGSFYEHAYDKRCVDSSAPPAAGPVAVDRAHL